MADNASQGNSGQGQEPGAGTQGQGQESGSQQGQNGNQGQEPGAGQQSQAGQQGGGQELDFGSMSEAELRDLATRQHRSLADVRREAADYRTRATAAEGKVTEAERAAMTEQQRVQSDLEAATATISERDNRIQELESEVDDLKRGSAIRTALGKAGALNEATVYRVGDWSDVKLKDDGTLDDATFQAALAKVRQGNDFMFRKGASANGGDGRTAGAPRSGSSINDLIRGGRTGQ